MKKEELKKVEIKDSEVLNFEALNTYMEPYLKAVNEEKLKKERFEKNIEKIREQIISLDRDIVNAQEKLNSEIATEGKASSKALDTVATLRRQREDLENTLIELKTKSLPLMDQNIRLAAIEMAKAFEQALNQLRPVYAGMINGAYAKIDSTLDDWLKGIGLAIEVYGQVLRAIDRGALKRLKGIKPNSDLISRLT